MRVICIDDREQDYDPEDGDMPCVKKGHIYTVIDSSKCKREETKMFYAPAGIWYTLAESGSEFAYHSSIFLPIIEDSQDETEMIREGMAKAEIK